MKRAAIFFTLLVSALPGLSQTALPKDVQVFVDRREGCDHMRGEIPEPSDKQRMKEVKREIRKLCAGTDKELARLKSKYSADPTVMQALHEFEPDIEAAETAAPKAKEKNR